jgi:hypothetical protein
MPRMMAMLARAHRRATGRAEIGAIPLHARGYSIEIGNVVIAQSHHVGRAGLLHIRRASILRVCASRRPSQYRKRNPGDDGRGSREPRIGLLYALRHCRSPLNSVRFMRGRTCIINQREARQAELGGR